MHTANQFWSSSLHCHLNDRERRCVGRENRASLDDRVELLEELLLCCEVLEDGLDNKVAVS
ncbi:unannotated protein [freshwater metagenome]|uniref:Unannotated protein n=1 Tax=freshwater metagenome TaxID=449393 RepID=A0A6J6WK89_9ZZZZ